MSDSTTPTTFDQLLASGRPLVADGAMGTSLFERGLEPGGCPELLNVDRPDMIAAVHRDFLAAGADIILTNTFGGNRRRLALHGLERRVPELNAAAVAVARSVAAESDRAVAVAGSIGPTGDLLHPLGPLGHEEAADVFAEQVTALERAGADVLWIETMSSREELTAALGAAARSDLPIVATMSFDTNGHTMMGFSPKQLGAWWREHADRVAAVGANCGIGPGDVVDAVFELTEESPDAVVVAKANCGIPLYKEDGLVYPAGADAMSSYVELALRSGARVIGACCGSTPAHVRAIRAAIDTTPAAVRPTQAEIHARLDVAARPAPTRRSGRRRR